MPVLRGAVYRCRLAAALPTMRQISGTLSAPMRWGIPTGPGMEINELTMSIFKIKNNFLQAPYYSKFIFIIESVA